MKKEQIQKKIHEAKTWIESNWTILLAVLAGVLVVLFLIKGINWMLFLAAGGTVPAILKANQKAAQKINSIHEESKKDLQGIIIKKEELKKKIERDSARAKEEGKSKTNEEIKKDILENIS
tara:strand:- start:109 stop:471 length:363 start_codon:yes stop_codon:yes gene_type:complete